MCPHVNRGQTIGDPRCGSFVVVFTPVRGLKTVLKCVGFDLKVRPVMRSEVFVVSQDPEKYSGEIATLAKTHSGLGHSAMYVREEKAAPLSLQSCWHLRVP